MFKLARNFELPIDYVTRCAGVLGQRGSGKTTAAVRLAEQMAVQNHPFIAVDPTGVWWGIRLAKTGVHPSPHEVLIVGGKHGDLALPLDKGEELARWLCAESVSAILDLSQHRQDEWEPFMVDFLEALYRYSESPRHVFIDEADLLAPQIANRGRLVLRNRVEDLVRRGRAKGLGVTMITQRAADLAKGVLGQVEILVVGRMVGRNDRKAVESWVEANGTPDQTRELMDSLSKLDTGHMWVWSPQWLDGVFEQVRVLARDTYDSSATPKAGTKVGGGRPLAAIDVEALKTLLVREDDDEGGAAAGPEQAVELRRLRDHVRVLEAELVDLRELDVVPVIEAGLNEVEEHLQQAAVGIGRLRESLVQAGHAPVGNLSPVPLVQLTSSAPAPVGRKGTRTKARPSAAAPPTVAPRPRPTRAPVAAATDASANGSLGRPHQRIVGSLRWWEAVGVDEPTRNQVAFVAGYKPGTGHYTNVLAEMRKEALIEYPQDGHLKLTDAGREKAPAVSLAKTEKALQAHIMSQLNGPQERVMQVLLQHPGMALRRDDLAEKSNYTLSGHFTNTLGSLHKLALVKYPRQGEVQATDLCFLSAKQ